MAKPSPMEPSFLVVVTSAEFNPTTWPLVSINGPPELP